MELRTMKFGSDLNVREEDSEKILEGYFVVFNQRTELYPGVFEEIRPEAVDKSLKETDVRALFNHEMGKVLGRVGNQTLELRKDKKGLWGSIKINPHDQEANNIYARVQRGDIDECSFGFYVRDEEVIRDVEKDTTLFVIKDADIVEISIVAKGAYSTTEVHARSRKEQVASIIQDELKERKRIDSIRKFNERFRKDN